MYGTGASGMTPPKENSQLSYLDEEVLSMEVTDNVRGTQCLHQRKINKLHSAQLNHSNISS